MRVNLLRLVAVFSTWLAWALLVPATIAWLDRGLRLGWFPPHADSIMIPIAGVILLVGVLSPVPILIGFFAVSASLFDPEPPDVRSRRRRGFAWFLAVLVILWTLMLAESVVYGDYEFIALGVIWIATTVALREAWIHKWPRGRQGA